MTSAKERVLEEIAKEWRNLEALPARVPPERMEEAGVVESWSMKDLIDDCVSRAERNCTSRAEGNRTTERRGVSIKVSWYVRA